MEPGDTRALSEHEVCAQSGRDMPGAFTLRDSLGLVSQSAGVSASPNNRATHLEGAGYGGRVTPHHPPWMGAITGAV